MNKKLSTSPVQYIILIKMYINIIICLLNLKMSNILRA